MQREGIIKAAAQIFREKGFHGTSMQDIADAVHLKKASLYHHIQSKQDILLSILDQALDLLISDLQPIVAGNQPPAQKLSQAMAVYIDRLTEDSDLSSVLLLEHRSLREDYRQQHIARRDRFESLWRRILTEGQQQGVFREMDVQVSVFALLGSQNWLITWFRKGDRYTSQELAELFADLFLAGLYKNGSAPS